MEHHSILRVVSKLLISPIILYALYVQWHGDYGPGGGFQAGVVFAVAFILYALAGVGVLIYAGTGVVTMLLGENFLGYNVLSHDPKHGQEWGIIVVEFGVGLTVASVMMSIFIAFACHNPPIKDEEW